MAGGANPSVPPAGPSSAISPELDRARAAIGDEIGADAAEFTPSTEKHFIGEAGLILYGGMFLCAFFKGFVEKAGEAAGKKLGKPAGSALGDFLLGAFKKLANKEVPVQDTEIESTRKEAVAAINATNTLSPEQIEAIGIAVQNAMTAALSAKANRRVSERVARRVRAEALKTMQVGQRR